jgi:hypothetical protein
VAVAEQPLVPSSCIGGTAGTVQASKGVPDCGRTVHWATGATHGPMMITRISRRWFRLRIWGLHPKQTCSSWPDMEEAAN